VKSVILLIATLLPAGAALAQDSVPAGTIIPVSLCGSISADHARPGQEIRVEVMQSIPGTPIRRRAKIFGHIVAATHSKNGPAQLVLRFDAVEIHGRRVPLDVNLRALASFNEVQAAQVPEEMGSRGITPEVATTQQIGGENVYRGGGPVAFGDMIVGRPTPYGVLDVPHTQPGGACRGVVAGNTRPQAFWLFSSDACGVYGYDTIRITETGRSEPMGTISLTAGKGPLKLYDGSGLLLRVQG